MLESAAFEFIRFLPHQHATAVQRVSPTGRLQRGALVLLSDAIALLSPRGGLNQYLPLSKLHSVTNYAQFGALCLHASPYESDAHDMLLVSAHFAPRHLQDVPLNNHANILSQQQQVVTDTLSSGGSYHNIDRDLKLLLGHISELIAARHGSPLVVVLDSTGTAPRCEKLSLAAKRRNPATSGFVGDVDNQSSENEFGQPHTTTHTALSSKKGSPVPRRLLEALATAEAAAKVRRANVLETAMMGTTATTTGKQTTIAPSKGQQHQQSSHSDASLVMDDVARRGNDVDGDRLTILLLSRYQPQPPAAETSASLHNKQQQQQQQQSYDSSRWAVLTVPTVHRLWSYFQFVASTVPELVPKEIFFSASPSTSFAAPSNRLQAHQYNSNKYIGRDPTVTSTNRLAQIEWETVFRQSVLGGAAPTAAASAPLTTATTENPTTVSASTVGGAQRSATAAKGRGVVPMEDRYVNVSCVEDPNPQRPVVLRLPFVLNVLEMFGEAQPHIVTVESFGQRHQVAGESLWGGAACNL